MAKMPIDVHEVGSEASPDILGKLAAQRLEQVLVSRADNSINIVADLTKKGAVAAHGASFSNKNKKNHQKRPKKSVQQKSPLPESQSADLNFQKGGHNQGGGGGGRGRNNYKGKKKFFKKSGGGPKGGNNQQ